jgi:hypothetical protein
MTPENRLDAIQRILSRLENQDWETVNLHLNLFGLPSEDWWRGDVRKYLIEMLEHAPAEKLSQLDRYLSGTIEEPILRSSSGNQGFEIFISHLAEERVVAGEVKRRLLAYGVSCFVAHQQIDAGLAWQEEIQSALTRCDSLIAIHHSQFSNSEWTGQEIGWVLGRGMPVVSLMVGERPKGFLSHIQAINVPRSKTPGDCVEQILTVLLRDERTHHQLRRQLLSSLEVSINFEMSNNILSAIHAGGIELTPDEYQQLLHAEITNYQLAGAHSWKAYKNIRQSAK